MQEKRLFKNVKNIIGVYKMGVATKIVRKIPKMTNPVFIIDTNKMEFEAMERRNNITNFRVKEKFKSKILFMFGQQNFSF